MPLRLGAAAMMAAILATLAVLIARAVIDPPVLPDLTGREAFLFQHMALAVPAAVICQLIFLRLGRPGYRAGLFWGLGGFVAVTLAPPLAIPQLPVGVVPLHDGEMLLFWLATVVITAAGLWLLARAGGPLRGGHTGSRVVGALLLLLPALLAPAADLPGEAGPQQGDTGGSFLADMQGSGDVILMLALNLLFWLALGLASVLAARQVVHRTS